MKHYYFIPVVVLLLNAAVSGHAWEGRTLEVRTSEVIAPFTPVAADFDGPAPAGPIELVNQATGEIAPASVSDNHLIFTPPSLTVEQVQRFTVRAPQTDAAPRVRLDHDADSGTVAVFVRDEHFTTYNFGEDARIPFLWPVYAEGGVPITRNFPMGTDEPVESRDHRHHVSLWVAFGDVNGADTWHRAPIKTNTVEVASGDAFGMIRAHNTWCDNRREPLVDEMREYRFYDGPAGVRLIDLRITFVAAHGAVTFGDNKEGLVAFRIRPEIQGNQSGLLTNAAGNQGERAVYGTPQPWMDYSGPVEGVGSRGIALFSHPDNFREPCWHVRDYGLFAANPFALSDVAKLGEDGSHALAEGERLTLTYRIYVHSGDVEEAGVARRYADFAGNPEVAWVE